MSVVCGCSCNSVCRYNTNVSDYRNILSLTAPSLLYLEDKLKTPLWNCGIYQSTGCHIYKGAIFLFTPVTNCELVYPFVIQFLFFFYKSKRMFLTFIWYSAFRRMSAQEIRMFNIVPIKCGKITISYLLSVDKQTLEAFLPIDPCCSYFAPLPHDVTYLKLYQKVKCLFCIWRRSRPTKRAMSIFHTCIIK